MQIVVLLGNTKQVLGFETLHRFQLSAQIKDISAGFWCKWQLKFFVDDSCLAF